MACRPPEALDDLAQLSDVVRAALADARLHEEPVEALSKSGLW